jgi:tetratricopeptide (TPR) repeat protein
MPEDSHGLALTIASPAAARAYDETVQGYLKYRADTPKRLQRLLEADPEFALGHCLKGYFMMLTYKAANLPAAAASAATAPQLAARATAREQAHVAALEAWLAGALDRMLAIWDEILAAHPTDVLAFRLAHFNNFWLGRADAMAASAEAVLPRWSAELPGYGTIWSCRGFAQEECGNYGVAELAARRALELDCGDLWAAHALAHVFEMQGRRGEGLAMIAAFEKHWEGANNLAHHLWWHRALYHLEQHDFAAVLALYDTRFRDLSAPLVEAQPDLYIDVQNAASMLFRLERQGVDAGERWAELADKAEARIGDCLSAFTLPHWMMALARTGRDAAAERLLASMRDFGAGAFTLAPIVRDYAVPVAEAVLLHARRQYPAAVARLRPALGGMYRLGGSHAQQDVFEQLFLDAAVKAGLDADVALLLERVAARFPVPPGRRIGYAAAARGRS